MQAGLVAVGEGGSGSPVAQSVAGAACCFPADPAAALASVLAASVLGARSIHCPAVAGLAAAEEGGWVHHPGVVVGSLVQTHCLGSCCACMR